MMHERLTVIGWSLAIAVAGCNGPLAKGEPEPAAEAGPHPHLTLRDCEDLCDLRNRAAAADREREELTAKRDQLQKDVERLKRAAALQGYHGELAGSDDPTLAPKPRKPGAP